VGFLSRLALAFRSDGSFTVTAEPLAAGALRSVVGESFYGPALERTAEMAVQGAPPLPVGRWVAVPVANREPDLPWFQAVLVREPDNRYDSNAIAVYSPAGKIGYLSREDAEEYQDVLIAVEDGGADGGACSAFLRRADNGDWGVVLALASPNVCLREMKTIRWFGRGAGRVEYQFAAPASRCDQGRRRSTITGC
jgi:HIRAN domain-containing protein